MFLLYKRKYDSKTGRGPLQVQLHCAFRFILYSEARLHRGRSCQVLLTKLLKALFLLQTHLCGLQPALHI